MGLESLVVDRFLGLTLPEDPEEVGFKQALDMANVDINRRGRLRTRDGYEVLTDEPSEDGAYRLIYPVDDQVLLASTTVGGGDLVDAINDGVLSETDTGVGVSSFASVGNEDDGRFIYIALGGNGIRRYDVAGETFQTAGLDDIPAQFLAVQSPSNRLVAAYGDRVRFSAPGDPETFDDDPVTGDWVDITPGDGESISGIATWLNLIFVFKETKFAVFTGNTVNSIGRAEFNYRMVDTGVGCVRDTTHPHSVTTVAPEGVYFGHESGIYLTTGGDPTPVSKAIEPLIYGDVPVEFNGISNVTPMALAYQHRRLYMVASDGDSNELYVFDLDEGVWLRWTLSVNGITAYKGRLFVSLTTSNDLAEITGTTDGGAAIEWNWSSGYSDLGTPEVKSLQWSYLWGSGTVTLQVAKDHGDLDTGSALTLGTAPAVVETIQRFSRDGRFFRFGISGTGPASVNRVIFYFRQPSDPGQR